MMYDKIQFIAFIIYLSDLLANLLNIEALLFAVNTSKI